MKGNSIIKKSYDDTTDKIDIKSEWNWFITLTYYKENFLNHLGSAPYDSHTKKRWLCLWLFSYEHGLINQLQNELQRIHPAIFEDTNKKSFEATEVKQYKNTVSKIKWFNLMKELKFVIFSIKDFYDSATNNQSIEKDSDFCW